MAVTGFNENVFAMVSFSKFGPTPRGRMHYGAANRLQLVCCPISNQEADWLFEDPEFREYVKHSHLYMICQHEEVFFGDWQIDKEAEALSFSLCTSKHRVEKLSLPLRQFFEHGENQPYALELGPKCIKIWNTSGELKTDIREWFTAEKLIFDVSRGNVGLLGTFDLAPFRRLRLHYVGISKKSDSLSRLFKTAHEKRSKILSNETQIRPGARLTDELFVLLFDIEDLQIKTFSPDEPDVAAAMADALLNPESLDKLKLVADAEKAFTNILQATYNTERYDGFPRSTDGLYDQGLDRYCYTIDEDLELYTDETEIRSMHNPMGRSSGDFIAISGDEVKLLKPSDAEKTNPSKPAP